VLLLFDKMQLQMQFSALGIAKGLNPFHPEYPARTPPVLLVSLLCNPLHTGTQSRGPEDFAKFFPEFLYLVRLKVHLYFVPDFSIVQREKTNKIVRLCGIAKQTIFGRLYKDNYIF
jgi:hypothetical protein